MIRYWITCLVLTAAVSCSTPRSTASHSFQPYRTVADPQAKILQGLLQRQDIENDTSFKWFRENYQLGRADPGAVAAFQKDSAQFNMIVFFGTWCEDSQNLLPVFFRLVDKSGYPENRITLIGVDRSKKSLDHLSEAFHITNVPTFIVMKDGKEAGRVVEYGKYGQIDRELGELVSGLP